jgi:protein-S-isoprenylcysteine O-methyltransferase Ste14
MKLKALIGSGDKIMLFTFPFLAVGLILNVLKPEFFTVGGPSEFLTIVSIIALIPGVIIWMWTVILILLKAPKGELITTGPFVVVKHPLYTGVSLLVIPWLGFLFNTWLGVLIGILIYLAARKYSKEEEAMLAKTFGKEWDAYTKRVLIDWL